MKILRPLLASFVFYGAVTIVPTAEATHPTEIGFGANPTLPAPDTNLIPTVLIAPPKGWPAGAKPTPAAGFAVTAFVSDLDHPRWIYVLPNGDVLVAETNAPAKPDEGLHETCGCRRPQRQPDLRSAVRWESRLIERAHS